MIYFAEQSESAREFYLVPAMVAGFVGCFELRITQPDEFVSYIRPQHAQELSKLFRIKEKA